MVARFHGVKLPWQEHTETSSSSTDEDWALRVQDKVSVIEGPALRNQCRHCKIVTTLSCPGGCRVSYCSDQCIRISLLVKGPNSHAKCCLQYEAQMSVWADAMDWSFRQTHDKRLVHKQRK